jgi:hypothetical protein
MKWLAFAFLLITRTDCTARAETPQRFAVTSLDVAHALLQRGLTVADDQISLPASIVSTIAEPILDVDSIEPLRAGPNNSHLRSKVKLVCHSSQLCLPFYAIVNQPLGSKLQAVALATPLPVSMRAGSNATLIVDTGEMHIQVPVICLQNGAIGARVHVVSPDRKQKYTATIVSTTVLRGSL